MLRVKSMVKLLAVWCGLSFGLLCLIEGCSGIVNLFVDLDFEEINLAESRHTKYDPELGWSNLRDVRLPEMYGPGRALTTNGQGFRATRNYAPMPERDVFRVVCSGDSFTLGFGVDDSQTWCSLLARQEPPVETINMGQGGYGMGQAFLWYRRDGLELNHHVHLFAFLVDDFDRMRGTTSDHYGKPRLRVHNGQLISENVPVPRLGYASPWLARNQRIFGRLNIVRLFNSVRGTKRAEAGFLSPKETWNILEHLVAELVRLNSARGITTIFVLLPGEIEIYYHDTDRKRLRLKKTMNIENVHYVDLTESMRRERNPDGLFIQPGDLPYLFAEGHYTARGNTYVAEYLRKTIENVRRRVSPTG